MTKARDIASAAPAPSTVSATELGYLDGVTSNIQTQIDSKTGGVATDTPPASPTEGQVWLDTDGTTADANFVLKSTLSSTGDIFYASSANNPARLGIGSTDQVLKVSGGVPVWGAAPVSSGPAFKANRSGSQQAFSQNVWTKVQLNSEIYDTDNCFDSTTNYRFTPNKAGYYQFNVRLWVSKTGQSLSQAAIYKNGSAESTTHSWTNTSTGYIMGGSDLIYLNGSTDYVELYVYDSDPSGRNIVDSSINTFFSGVWIRS